MGPANVVKQAKVRSNIIALIKKFEVRNSTYTDS